MHTSLQVFIPVDAMHNSLFHHEANPENDYNLKLEKWLYSAFLLHFN